MSRDAEASGDFEAFVARRWPEAERAMALMTGADRVPARAATNRAFARVWALRWLPSWMQSWLVGADPDRRLRRALVREARPHTKVDPPSQGAAQPWRARARSAREQGGDDAPVFGRRALFVTGAGAAALGGTAAAGWAASQSLHVDRVRLVAGDRLNLSLEIAGRGPRRLTTVFTDDPRWSPDLPARVGSLMIDDARPSWLVLPSPGLTSEATLRTMVVHLPGMVFCDVVDREAVSFTVSPEVPLGAALFSPDRHLPLTLVWGDDRGRVHGDEALVHAGFPADDGQVCYLMRDRLVVRRLQRGNQPASGATWSVPCEPAEAADHGAPPTRVLATRLADGTGLLAILCDEPGEVSWDEAVIAASQDDAGRLRLWHMRELPRSRGAGRAAVHTLTLRTSSRVWRYQVNF